jgi:hypothetical protein
VRTVDRANAVSVCVCDSVGREHVLGQDLGKILATWYRARSQSHGLDRNLDHSVVVFSLFIRLFVVLNNPGGDTDRLELI